MERRIDKPVTQSIRERIELVLIEEVNKTEGIQQFIQQATDRLLELVIDERNYGQRFRSH